MWTFQYSDIFYPRKFFQVFNIYFVRSMFKRVLSSLWGIRVSSSYRQIYKLSILPNL